jgi:hypothetical protein
LQCVVGSQRCHVTLGSDHSIIVVGADTGVYYQIQFDPETRTSSILHTLPFFSFA